MEIAKWKCVMKIIVKIVNRKLQNENAQWKLHSGNA